MANSSMLVLPRVTMPAAFSFSTTVASYGDTKLSSIFEPQLVRTSFVQKMSLCASGSPVSGPAFPEPKVASATFACARADSGVTVMKELSAGCDASMRASRLFVSSVTENSLARSFFASSDSVSVCIGLKTFLLDDLGNEIQRGFDLRSVALVLLVLVLFGHDIGPHALCESRKRMRHRLDARGFCRVELAHEVDDLRKAVLVDRYLRFGQ